MGFMQQLSVQDLRVFQFRPFIPLTTSSRQVATTIYAGSKRAIFAVINGRVNPYWGKISYKSSVPINLLTTYLGIYRSTTYQLGIQYLLPIKELNSNRIEHFQVSLSHCGFSSSQTILLTFYYSGKIHTTTTTRTTTTTKKRRILLLQRLESYCVPCIVAFF